MMKNRMRAFGFVPVLFLAAATLAAQEPFRLQEATIEQIQAALKSKRVTCRDLIGHYLKRIEAYDQAGPKLNAVQTVNKEAVAYRIFGYDESGMTSAEVEHFRKIQAPFWLEIREDIALDDKPIVSLYWRQTLNAIELERIEPH